MNNILQVDRMKAELEGLRENREDLVDFIYDSPEYEELERCEQVILIKQLGAMESYDIYLSKRIFWEATKEVEGEEVEQEEQEEELE